MWGVLQRAQDLASNVKSALLDPDYDEAAAEAAQVCPQEWEMGRGIPWVGGPVSSRADHWLPHWQCGLWATALKPCLACWPVTNTHERGRPGAYSLLALRHAHTG
jgi:hypothetical protein